MNPLVLKIINSKKDNTYIYNVLNTSLDYYFVGKLNVQSKSSEHMWIQKKSRLKNDCFRQI